MSFSLLTEPWLPLISTDGRRQAVSLLDALLEPGRWRGLDGANPIETLSLHRLLLAICHRAIGPSVDPRTDLLARWPRSALEAYLDRWANNFDLLHPQTPFLQVPALAEANLSPSPWSRLAHDRASGAARMIWDHSIDDQPERQPFAQMARLLIAHLQFTPGSLVKALRTSAVRGPACSLLLMLPLGDSLQETMALNLCTQAKQRHVLDLPTWERPPLRLEDLRKPRDEVIEGPAHRYTFLSRAVLLLPDGAGISELLYAEGLKTGEDTTPDKDPMAATITLKKGTMALLLSEQKAFWRDFPALHGSKGYTAAEVVNHALELRKEPHRNGRLAMLAGGMLCDKAKILFWRLEQRQLSPEVLGRQALITASDRALELAEETGSEFSKSVYGLCSAWLKRGGDKDPDPKDVRGLQDSIQAGALFWGSLEPAFWVFIQRLADSGDPDTCLSEWREELRASVRDAWRHATLSLGMDSRALAAAGALEHRQRKILAALKA
jgi:CRISPR system Cascade subunit CasA